MNDRYIEQLSKLQLEEKHLKRCLDIRYYNKEQRSAFFNRIKEIRKEMEQLKFKIRFEKEINNVKDSNTNKSSN